MILIISRHLYRTVLINVYWEGSNKEVSRLTDRQNHKCEEIEIWYAGTLSQEEIKDISDFLEIPSDRGTNGWGN